jgi:hypothetical protein
LEYQPGILWGKDDFCDFFDIRIPPQKNCKELMPVNTNYNLYFSNTPEESDDEMLEIFTGKIKSVTLFPELTVINNSINLNQ